MQQVKFSINVSSTSDVIIQWSLTNMKPIYKKLSVILTSSSLSELALRKNKILFDSDKRCNRLNFQ